MSEFLNFLKDTASELLSKLNIASSIEASEKEGVLSLNLTGENLGILIGYHGETLAAIQTWLVLSLHRQFGEWKEVLVDIAGYAAEREQRLREIATNAADRARFLAKPIELTPMSAYERRLIHTAIGEIPGMKSESTGEGYDRRVVVSAV